MLSACGIYAQDTPTVAPSTTVVTDKPVVVKPAKAEEGPEEEPAAPASAWVNPEHDSENYLTSLTEGWFFGGDIGKTAFYGDVALYNVFPKFGDFKKSLSNAGSFYFGKKLIYGLSVELEGHMGSFRGQKLSGRLYPRKFEGDFFQYSGSVKYNLSQLIFRDTPGRKFFNRFTVYITGGAGQMFFRSRLYKQANNGIWYLENASGYTTRGIDSVGPTIGSGIVTQKTKMIAALAIPAGAKINFKLNGQTDLVLNLTYTTIFSDQVDAWVRDWSHRDRYLYMGVGLTHNINSGKDGDIPDDQRFFRPKAKKSKDAYKKSKDDDDDDSKPAKRTGGLFNFGGKSKSSANKEVDKDLEVRMKMYELQLKLFEMQYLMGHQ